MRSPGAAQRGLGDVDPDRLRACLRQQTREVAVATPEIQGLIAPMDVVAQESPTQLEVWRLEVLRELFPQLFVVVAHAWP
jgi:hypothetical protein